MVKLLPLLKCVHNRCQGPRGSWAAVTGAWGSHDYVSTPWFIHSSGGPWTVMSTSVWQLPVSLYKVTTQHHWQASHKPKHNAPTHSHIPSSNLHSLHQILSNLKPCTLFMCIDNTDPECAVSSQNQKKKRFPPILRTHKFLKLGLVFTSGKVLSLQRHLQLLSYRWRRVERFQFICTTICIQTHDKKHNPC